MLKVKRQKSNNIQGPYMQRRANFGGRLNPVDVIKKNPTALISVGRRATGYGYGYIPQIGNTSYDDSRAGGMKRRVVRRRRMGGKPKFGTRLLGRINNFFKKSKLLSTIASAVAPEISMAVPELSPLITGAQGSLAKTGYGRRRRVVRRRRKGGRNPLTAVNKFLKGTKLLSKIAQSVGPSISRIHQLAPLVQGVQGTISKAGYGKRRRKKRVKRVRRM